MQGLENKLEANHYKNRHGCWLTDYGKIDGLVVKASTTNGTSGIGRYKGLRVYWWRNDRQGRFIVERA